MHIRCSVGGDALGDNAGMDLDDRCPQIESSSKRTIEVATRSNEPRGGGMATFGTVLNSGKDALIFSSAEDESSMNLMVRAFAIEAKKAAILRYCRGLVHPPHTATPTPGLESSLPHHMSMSTANLQVPTVSRSNLGTHHAEHSSSETDKQQHTKKSNEGVLVLADDEEDDGVMTRATTTAMLPTSSYRQIPANQVATEYDLYSKLPHATTYNDRILQGNDNADRMRRYLQQKREAGFQNTANLNTLPLHLREAVMSQILKNTYPETNPHGEANTPRNFALEKVEAPSAPPQHALETNGKSNDVSPPPREKVIELYSSASTPREEKLNRPKHFMTALSRWNKNSALFRSEKVPLPSTFQPTPFTVLLGHKKEFRLSSGNRHLKSLCERYRERYDREDREGKSDVVSTILTAVYSRCPVGAFVKEIHGKYYEVEDLLARDKIAADLRKLLPGKYRSVPKRKGVTPSSDEDTTTRESSPDLEGDKTKPEPGSPISNTTTSKKH